jgi:two-component system sensor histidine kinase CreC
MNGGDDPAAAVARRPISRRILVALFLLMTVPMAGWYFVGDFTARGLVDALTGAQRDTVLEVQRQVRFKLALVLGASIAALGGVILYLRRTVLDRLEALARQTRRARGIRHGPWVPSAELFEPDEIGDLARALDSALGRLEQRAEEASRFADDLGHELRTPLAAIRGAAELLAEPDLSPAERRRFTAHVLAESERLERLVAGLLDLARAEGRSAEAPAPPIELAPLLADLARAVEPLAAAAGVRLTVIAERELPPLALDSDLLRRALVPLIENALRHSPAGGEVRLVLERRGEVALVAVEDQGPGVPPELRERIFDRFFFEASDRGPPGAGLGLAIARRAAARLGGRVWVEDAASSGARFVLALPA